MGAAESAVGLVGVIGRRKRNGGVSKISSENSGKRKK
jgi:hypothetical protein